MKRGIDEKNIGPMFPRLHVNDTEKGGPRAPPRNKMALYEQLSIPSQRFTTNNSTSKNTTIPPTSSQGGGSQRGSFLAPQQTPTLHTPDHTNNQYSDLNNIPVQQDERKNQEDEDYTVPIFVHQNKDNKAHSPFSSSFLDRSTNLKRTRERSNSRGLNKESMRAIRDDQQEVVRSLNDHGNCDTVSETSIVDSISAADISPDDVVGVIGQKHFWKARRAIVNQQRVFAVQIFELHRLIKVQRLIAGSPQLIVEDDTFLGKPAKVSQIKKIPLQYVLKSSSNVPKIKDYHDKPNDNTTREFSAENVVEKASVSTVQNSSRSTFTGYPLPPSDPKMGAWNLGQQPGHQWLIPVMSPSEGLIYKPYPGPGYMTPGPGPPLGHNVVNHGVPPQPPPHYQWPTGFQPLVHPPFHGYFPHYGMTTINPPHGDEINPNPNLLNMQYQSSNNVPVLANFHGSNSEVQGSTASSPSERRESHDPLPLFPTNPPTKEHLEPTRAIRVVPRNARLATESVARIFQSIQEERKQH